MNRKNGLFIGFAALMIAALIVAAGCSSPTTGGGSNLIGGGDPVTSKTFTGKDGTGKNIVITIAETLTDASKAVYTPATGGYYTVKRDGVIIDRGRITLESDNVTITFKSTVDTSVTFDINDSTGTVSGTIKITVGAGIGTTITINTPLKGNEGGSKELGNIIGTWYSYVHTQTGIMVDYNYTFTGNSVTRTKEEGGDISPGSWLLESNNTKLSLDFGTANFEDKYEYSLTWVDANTITIPTQDPAYPFTWKRGGVSGTRGDVIGRWALYLPSMTGTIHGRTYTLTVTTPSQSNTSYKTFCMKDVAGDGSLSYGSWSLANNDTILVFTYADINHDPPTERWQITTWNDANTITTQKDGVLDADHTGTWKRQ